MAAHHALWQRIIDAMGRYKRERELIERLRTTSARVRRSRIGNRSWPRRANRWRCR
jgi:hypothetical protein